MNKGFTLVELVVIIGIFSALAVFGVSTYRAVGARNDLVLAVPKTVPAHRTAYVRARSMTDDMPWGVNIIQGEAVVFRGPSYVGRDTEADTVYMLSPRVVPSGATEIVYAKFTGLPNSTGDIILTLNNEAQAITINEQGAVLY